VPATTATERPSVSKSGSENRKSSSKVLHDGLSTQHNRDMRTSILQYEYDDDSKNTLRQQPNIRSIYAQDSV